MATTAMVMSTSFVSTDSDHWVDQSGIAAVNSSPKGKEIPAQGERRLAAKPWVGSDCSFTNPEGVRHQIRAAFRIVEPLQGSEPSWCCLSRVRPKRATLGWYLNPLWGLGCCSIVLRRQQPSNNSSLLTRFLQMLLQE